MWTVNFGCMWREGCAGSIRGRRGRSGKDNTIVFAGGQYDSDSVGMLWGRGEEEFN